MKGRTVGSRAITFSLRLVDGRCSKNRPALRTNDEYPVSRAQLALNRCNYEIPAKPALWQRHSSLSSISRYVDPLLVGKFNDYSL